jgi:4-hydroxybenzoate polyprenyltransferase
LEKTKDISRELLVYERIFKDLNVLDILIYGSVYLSLGAAATMYASCILLGLNPQTELLFIAFSSTFAVYNFNRLTDKKEDIINHPKRYKFHMKYGHAFLYTAVVIYGASLFLAAQKGILQVMLVVFPFFMGLLYSIKLPSMHKKRHGKKKYTRLKDIPLVKNLTATTAWTVPMLFLPTLYMTRSLDLSFAFIFIFIYLRDLINTTTFDIRDIEGDKSHNVLTLPVIYGLDKCKRVLSALNLALFGIISGASCLGILSATAFIAVCLSTLYTDFYLSIITKKVNPVVLYEIIIDGEFIAFAVFVLLGRLVT